MCKTLFIGTAVAMAKRGWCTPLPNCKLQLQWFS